MPKKLILVIGAPGSGKSTDSKILAEKYKEDITTISVGELLREEIKRGSGVGHI
ncbi:MAG TPA: adenylate kinase, partial [Sulfurovum sp.]|nr:adenylate kinase [Sulfurovum sp.]